MLNLNYDPNRYLDTLSEEDRRIATCGIAINAWCNSSEPIPEAEEEWIAYVDKELKNHYDYLKKEAEKKAKKAAKEAAKSPEQREYERCRRNYLARHREAEKLRAELEEIAAKEAYWKKKMDEADKLR